MKSTHAVTVLEAVLDQRRRSLAALNESFSQAQQTCIALGVEKSVCEAEIEGLEEGIAKLKKPESLPVFAPLKDG